MAYPYEYLSSIDDYKNSVDNLKKEDFFSKLKNSYPSDDEIQRTKVVFNFFNIQIGGELTKLYLKSDVILLTCMFEKFSKVSINEIDFNL